MLIVHLLVWAAYCLWLFATRHYVPPIIGACGIVPVGLFVVAVAWLRRCISPAREQPWLRALDACWQGVSPQELRAQEREYQEQKEERLARAALRQANLEAMRPRVTALGIDWSTFEALAFERGTYGAAEFLVEREHEAQLRRDADQLSCSLLVRPYLDVHRISDAERMLARVRSLLERAKQLNCAEAHTLLSQGQLEEAERRVDDAQHLTSLNADLDRLAPRIAALGIAAGSGLRPRYSEVASMPRGTRDERRRFASALHDLERDLKKAEE
jgi:hypothetical protein